MNDYILLMHGDTTDQAAADDGAKWGAYMTMLHQSGQFDGGSAIGAGICAKQFGTADAASKLSGYIRVRAASLEDAKRFLIGNPSYEAGSTVEICELPRD